MRAALADGAEFVWFLNNDAAPEAEALGELVRVAQSDAGIAVVGAKVLLRHDPGRLDSIALHVNLRTGRIYLTGHDEVDRGQYDRLTDTDAVTGCAMLVRRAACEELGGFDERFFAYLEDADLCLRARAAGRRVLAAPRARVLHNRPVAARGRQSVASLYYTTRNHLMLIERHGVGPARRRRLQRAVVVALNCAYALRGRGRMVRLRAVRRGVRDYRRGVTAGAWTDAPAD
jgi:GT2 family glycosyltransferase